MNDTHCKGPLPKIFTPPELPRPSLPSIVRLLMKTALALIIGLCIYRGFQILGNHPKANSAVDTHTTAFACGPGERYVEIPYGISTINLSPCGDKDGWSPTFLFPYFYRHMMIEQTNVLDFAMKLESLPQPLVVRDVRPTENALSKAGKTGAEKIRSVRIRNITNQTVRITIHLT